MARINCLRLTALGNMRDKLKWQQWFISLLRIKLPLFEMLQFPYLLAYNSILTPQSMQKLSGAECWWVDDTLLHAAGTFSPILIPYLYSVVLYLFGENIFFPQNLIFYTYRMRHLKLVFHKHCSILSTCMPVIYMSASSILDQHPHEPAVLSCIFWDVADNLSGNRSCV